MDVPDTLKEKVEIFRANGQIFREEDELFTETSWAAVMMGQGITMGGHNAMADALDPGTLRTRGGRDGKVDPLPRPAHAGAWRLSGALLPCTDRSVTAG